MLTIFNRTELTLTQDIARQAAIRSALSAAGIEHFVKARNLTTNARGSFLGVRAVWEYRIYVNRKDFDLARHILSGLQP